MGCSLSGTHLFILPSGSLERRINVFYVPVVNLDLDFWLEVCVISGHLFS